MGIVNNECVLVTTWVEDLAKIEKYIDAVPKPYKSLFAIIHGIINNKVTVVLAPSGSKKGWDTDKHIQNLRDDFISFINNLSYSSWIEVSYGEYGQKVLRGNCDEYII